MNLLRLLVSGPVQPGLARILLPGRGGGGGAVGRARAVRSGAGWVWLAGWVGLGLAGVGAVSGLAATVRNWTGASPTSGNWTSAANWANGVPVPGDILNFVDTGARRSSNTNNFPAGTTFSTINLFGTGWLLRGNAVTISNYVGQGAPSGTNRVDLDITAAGPGVGLTLRSVAASDRLTIDGGINLAGRTLQTEGPGDFVVSGVIQGSGDIYKAHSGELILAGLGANTYSGDTVVAGGILRLGRYILGAGLTFEGTVAVPGDLYIGGFGGVVVGDVVALERDDQIADTSVVRVNATGSLELGDATDRLGGLELRGGTVTSGDGVLSVDGPIVAAAPSGVTKDSVVGGRWSLGTRGDPAQMVDVAQGVQLFVTAVVSGVSTADLVKTNRGELWLTRSNTFGGDVVVRGGTVVVADRTALGTTVGVTRVELGTLAVSGSLGVPERLVVPGPAAMLAVLDGNPSWLGDVELVDDLSLSVPASRSLSVVGRISGPSGWTKLGDGTLQFKTAWTNDYGGTSWVREGGFVMDGVLNQPVIPGPLVVGNATDPTNSTRAWMIKSNQIADHAPVTLNRSGVLQLGGFNDTVGPITFNGGAIESDLGTLTLNGDVLVNATNEMARWLGRVSLGGAVRTIYTLGTSNSPDLDLRAAISDGGAPGGLHKIGEGSLRLAGGNTFNGPVLVTDGQLRVAHPNALGSAVGGTEVSGIDGPRLVLEASVGMTIAAEPLTLNSSAPGSPIVLENFTGNNEWNGPVALLAESSVIHVPSPPRPLAINGPITGAGGLRKTGAGVLRMFGAGVNTYQGLTVVAEGDLVLDKAASEAVKGNLLIGDGVGGLNADRVIVLSADEIANTSRVAVESSGLLLLDGVQELIGSLQGNGNVLLNGPVSGLVVGRNDLSTTFDGVITGAGAFEKVGKGVLTLTGVHTYTGETGATEGTLVVNGSVAASSGLSVNRPLNVPKNPPGVLAGVGTVPRLLPYPGGFVAPGAGAAPGAGRLTVQGKADLTALTLRVELNGTQPGVGHDQLRVLGGDVILDQTALQLASSVVPATNDVFVILDKQSPGPVSGSFLNAAEGSVQFSGGQHFRISYVGGDGNDVVLRRAELGASQLTGVRAVNGERMVVTGQGVPFATYVLEFTPALESPVTWTAISTNQANAAGIYEFVDRYADGGAVLHPARFYRVQTP